MTEQLEQVERERLDQVAQVDRLRSEGKTAKDACKSVGISVPIYYEKRRQVKKRPLLDWRRDAVPQEKPIIVDTSSNRNDLRELAADQYFAIRAAIKALDASEYDRARRVLNAALRG